MKKGNVIIVFHHSENKILMCLRQKQPYLGKYNLVGGKLEENEDIFDSAYREMQEESGITKEDITLTHVMNMQFMMDHFELQVFAGKLKREVCLKEEINPLYWIDLSEDFTGDKFAGEGNIQYMLNYIDTYLPEIRK